MKNQKITVLVAIFLMFCCTHVGAQTADSSTSKWAINSVNVETNTATLQMMQEGYSQKVNVDPGKTFLMIDAVFSCTDGVPSGKLEDIYLTDSKKNVWKLKGIEFYYENSRCYFFPETLLGMFGMIAPSSDNSPTLELRGRGGDSANRITYVLSKPAGHLDLLFSIPVDVMSRKFTLHFSGTIIDLPKVNKGQGVTH